MNSCRNGRPNSQHRPRLWRLLAVNSCRNGRPNSQSGSRPRAILREGGQGAARSASAPYRPKAIGQNTERRSREHTDEAGGRRRERARRPARRVRVRNGRPNSASSVANGSGMAAECNRKGCRRWFGRARRPVAPLLRRVRRARPTDRKRSDKTPSGEAASIRTKRAGGGANAPAVPPGESANRRSREHTIRTKRVGNGANAPAVPPSESAS